MVRADLLPASVSLATLAAATVAMRAVPGLSPTTVALVLLLVVLGTATRARLPVAIGASIAAMLSFNFFFLPPVGTLTIADPENWVALIAFLVVSVLASHLSTAVRSRADEAVARRNEVTRLFDLSRDVLLATETTGAVDALAAHVARRFELTAVAICLPGAGGWTIHQGGTEPLPLDTASLDAALVRAQGVLESNARRRDRGGRAADGPDRGVWLVPLRHGTKAVGLLATASAALDTSALDAVAGVVAIAIERAQLLAERDATEQVRQRADLASTLLASLSHDLRTPLTAIGVAVANLARALPADERRAQSDAAVAEVGRLTRLVQDILDMARIDAGAIALDRQWVAASDIVDAALAHVRHALSGRALQIDAGDALEVELDPRLVSAALAHLLENAAQYSPSDRLIAVAARIDRDGLHVCVTDQGPGLDPGELEHLFERFYRGAAGRRSAFGTGMGLSITRGLLAAAGGRVRAENMASGGARFSIHVPGPVRPATVAQ